MSRTIYNEGRVVGLSAYEIFVKHAIAAGIDPGDVPSEQTWLAASIGMGASLILYIPAGTSDTITKQLSADSTLAAANTIIGSFFNGAGEHTGSGAQWITSITDYGNGSATNPQPATPNQDALTDYLKIVDGNVNQSGDRTGQPPEMAQPYLVPDLTANGTATVSITFSTATAHGFYLQLTGFTDKSVLAGVVGTDGNQQATTNKPNGDFIGPEVFPWSTKIIFTIPTAATPAMLSHIKTGSPSLAVSDPDTNYDVTLTVNDSEVVKQGLEISAKPRGGIKVDYTQHSGGNKEKYVIGTLLDAGNGIDIGDGTETNHIAISANLTSVHGSGITITPTGAGSPIQISTNLDSKNDSGIDFETDDPDTYPNSTKKYIKASLEAGSGITIDGTATDPKAKKISANISAGNGIDISPGTGTKRIIKANLTSIDHSGIKIDATKNPIEISASLEQGTGIKIEDGSDSKAKKINANIIGGPGIIVNESNGAWRISSSELGRGYRTVTNGEDYIAHSYNQFCSNNRETNAFVWDSDDTQRLGCLTVRVLESSDTRGYYQIPADTSQPYDWSTNKFTAYYTDTSGTLNTQSDWTTALAGGIYRGKPSSVGIKISGYNSINKYSLAKLPYHEAKTTNPPEDKQNGFCLPTYTGGNYDYLNSNSGFAFRHAESSTSDQGKLSCIFGLEFSGLLVYLNDTASYTFSDSSGETTGIWNISRYKDRPSSDWAANSTTSTPENPATDSTTGDTLYLTFGGSWAAVCRLENGDSNHIGSRIVAYAGSYSDGFNSQFTTIAAKWTSLSDDNAGKDLCARSINLNLSGTFYIR